MLSKESEFLSYGKVKSPADKKKSKYNANPRGDLRLRKTHELGFSTDKEWSPTALCKAEETYNI